MVSVNTSRQKRGADMNLNMRISPQLRTPLERAYRHKLKKLKKANIDPKGYGFSTFVREMANEGLKHYCLANEI
jgi:hypothetical protein